MRVVDDDAIPRAIVGVFLALALGQTDALAAEGESTPAQAEQLVITGPH